MGLLSLLPDKVRRTSRDIALLVIGILLGIWGTVGVEWLRRG